LQNYRGKQKDRQAETAKMKSRMVPGMPLAGRVDAFSTSDTDKEAPPSTLFETGLHTQHYMYYELYVFIIQDLHFTHSAS
jgi:hypothetical protein